MKRSGFTLLEALLYLAVSSAIVLAIAMLLRFVVDGRERYAAIAESVQQSSWISHRFVAAVQLAGSITSPAVGQSSETLVLGDGTVIESTGGFLTIQPLGGPAQPLNTADLELTALSFTRAQAASGSADLVRMQFTFIAASSALAVQPYTHTYVTSAAILH